MGSEFGKQVYTLGVHFLHNEEQYFKKVIVYSEKSNWWSCVDQNLLPMFAKTGLNFKCNRITINLKYLLICHMSLQDRSAFIKLLDDTENWLYEDGEDESKTVYVNKLAELKVSIYSWVKIMLIFEINKKMW